jgi:uncharacterized protein YkwD
MLRAPKSSRRAVGARFAMALLLVISAPAMQPSSQLMASSDGTADGTAEGVAKGSSEPAQRSAQPATLKPASATSPDIPLNDYDAEAEHQLLDLANQARAQAGAPLLTLDTGLSRAARAHAETMFAERQLSHQFEGEPSLPQRLADATRTQLDQEGENVALDFDAARAQQHLMLSPPHRANLLNPAYNVVGLGVVRSGDRLYIVQDFGHALPNYSAAEVKDRVAATVAQTRHQAKQPDLARQDLPTADDAACSMAQADKLGTSPIHQLAERYTVLTYTSLHPEALPTNADHVLSSHNLRSFSIGTCYARTQTYPTGVYWVVLLLD